MMIIRNTFAEVYWAVVKGSDGYSNETVSITNLHLINVTEVAEKQIILKQIDYGRLVMRRHAEYPKVISFILGHDMADV